MLLLHSPQVRHAGLLALPLIYTAPVLAEDETDAPALPKLTVTAKSAGDHAQGYLSDQSRAATKTDTPLLETPLSISVVTDVQMEAQNVGTLAEALRYTPGVHSEASGFEPRTTFLKMRGFDVTETGLYRDGLKLVNPAFALELYGAERVEVPRGPVSVLYGQAGPGGLVNYASKRPIFDPLREIKFEAGSFDRLQGELDVSGPVDDAKTLAYRVTGLVRDSDSQVDSIPDNRVYVAPALTWKPSNATTLTFLSHYQKDKTKPSQRLPAEGSLYGNVNGRIPTHRFTGEPDVDSYDREEFAVGYLFEHRLSEAVTLRQNARYYSNRVDDRTIYTTALLADQRTTSRALYESFGQVGGFNLDNQVQFRFATGVLDHTRSRLSGARANQSSEETTGRAGLSYVADNGLAPYFSYAQSFLPTLGSDSAGKPFQPETGEQYEFGVKFQPKNSKSLVTLAYFDLTRQNFLSTDPATYANVQKGEAHSRGVELEGVADFDNGLNLTASYAYVDAELTKSSARVEVGDQLEYAPKHKVSLWADYTVQSGVTKGLGIGGGARYTGTSVGNSYLAKNTLEIPDYVLFDASVHYSWQQVQLTVNLQNVFDKNYVATAFTSGGDFATFGPRRVVTGSIQYSF